eukprot:12900339-Prorocentrum_lima.AAC.1
MEGGIDFDMLQHSPRLLEHPATRQFEHQLLNRDGIQQGWSEKHYNLHHVAKRLIDPGVPE